MEYLLCSGRTGLTASHILSSSRGLVISSSPIQMDGQADLTDTFDPADAGDQFEFYPDGRSELETAGPMASPVSTSHSGLEDEAGSESAPESGTESEGEFGV